MRVLSGGITRQWSTNRTLPFRYYERLAGKTPITLGQQLVMVDHTFADVDPTRPSLTAPACSFPCKHYRPRALSADTRWTAYDNQVNPLPAKSFYFPVTRPPRRRTGVHPRLLRQRWAGQRGRAQAALPCTARAPLLCLLLRLTLPGIKGSFSSTSFKKKINVIQFSEVQCQ